jgi:hypothetical protein
VTDLPPQGVSQAAALLFQRFHLRAPFRSPGKQVLGCGGSGPPEKLGLGIQPLQLCQVLPHQKGHPPDGSRMGRKDVQLVAIPQVKAV